MSSRARALAVPAALLTVLGLAGCNTMSGMGRDITGTADYVQDYMPPELQKNGGAGKGFPAPASASTAFGVPSLSGL